MSSVLFDIPGPKARARHRLIMIVSAVLTLLALAWAISRFAAKGNLEAAKWTPFLTGDIWVNYLIPGLVNTLKAAAISVEADPPLRLMADGELAGWTPLRIRVLPDELDLLA